MAGAVDKARDQLGEGIASRGRASANYVIRFLEKRLLQQRPHRSPACLAGTRLSSALSVWRLEGQSRVRSRPVSSRTNGGRISDDVKADLNSRAGTVSQSLREVSDKLKAELGEIRAPKRLIG
jgi:hypothetical protein